LIPSLFRRDLPWQSVNGNLMVGLQSKDILNELALDSAKIIEAGKKYSFDAVHAFAMLQDKTVAASERNFAPALGIIEEAATGTACGAFLAYLQHNNQLPHQKQYVIEQGEAMQSLSRLYGKFEDDRVWIGGRALVLKNQVMTTGLQ